MDWLYQGQPLTELPEHTFGFIYKITYTNGQKYIGKKACFSKSTLPALKTGVPRPGSERVGKNRNGKRVYFDIVTKENKWCDYEGSSGRDLSDLEIATKEIIEFAPTKRSLTYLETKHLFCQDAIIDEDFINDCILKKFYRGRLL